jgi:membrane-bound metal-dependent hydrolase YbcI (DUF457 family)
MFAGHVGVALALGGAERRVNVGVFVGAALLLDAVLWLLVLFGLESVSIPADFARTHQPDFVFPYSHGLLARLLWSAIAGAAALLAWSRRPALKWRVALLVFAAVFSHWLIDALVHRPEMPLIGGASSMVGLGWWNHMPVALGIEATIVALGVYLFVPGSRLPRNRSISLTVLTLVVLAFTVAGMTVAPPPPSALAMAGSSLASLGLVFALFCWLGRHPCAARVTDHRGDVL